MNEPTQTDAVAPTTPETPTVVPEVPETPRKAVDLEAIIADITAMDWLKIRRELDLSADEILEDSVAMMLVAAVRVGAEETALMQWEKFGAMTPEQLSEYLGIEVVADPKSQP